MRIASTVSLFLTLGLIHPAHLSFSAPPEDLEGSGDDFDSLGSGSGDWSEQVEKNINVRISSKYVTLVETNAGVGAKNAFRGSSVRTSDDTRRPAKDSRSGYVIVANGKSFLERKEILSAVIAGAVTGGIFAVSLAAILIYKWQKTDDGGYILGQQRASDEDYHTPNREEVV